MRLGRLMILLIAAATVSCDSGPADQSHTANTAASTTQSAPASKPSFEERLQAITGIAPIPTTTRPATEPAPATTRAVVIDPLATPTSAANLMFELMRKRDVLGIRAIMAEPLPYAQLQRDVRTVSRRMAAGAKVEIVDMKIVGPAAVVIYRTTYKGTLDEVTPLVLVNRYEHWKVVLGEVTLKTFTENEINSTRNAMEWAGRRIEELRPKATTKPATEPATGPATKP
jgi:hypothetical protein